MENEALFRQIEQVRSGDETALACLIAKQMPAIRSIASQAVCPGLDFDDAVQEGIIALFHSIETFDMQRGASFRTYANVCVQNAVADAARAATRAKHAPLNHSVPISDREATPGPEETVLADEAYTQALCSIRSRLSALEKQVLSRFLDGESYAAIAKALGVPEKTVDNALQRVRAKLK